MNQLTTHFLGSCLLILLLHITPLYAQDDTLPNDLLPDAEEPAEGDAFIEEPDTREKKIPEALEDWVDWATWDLSRIPTYYHDHKKREPVWTSQLDLSVAEKDGEFSLGATVFKKAWVKLPGNKEAWPLSVTANGEEVPVMSANGIPTILLDSGKWDIQGNFSWDVMPQSLMLPKSIGVLSLRRENTLVNNPSWDASGKLWLKRTTTEAADKNYLEVQVYRNLRDGSPMWLNTDVDLTVTGKSREEELGVILPEGWKISQMSSNIPVAVDDNGLLKTQVRAGKWVISILAFRTSPAETVSYPEGSTPAVEEELISLQNDPNFRIIEFIGLQAVDVAQTTFPEKWRSYPVHIWETSKSFQLDEKMRGMGKARPPGIQISRSFWLDEDGKELTYRDDIQGSALQTWRLDAAEGQRLGAAKIGEASQLITKNPLTGDTGVEVRTRNLNLQSVGRMANTSTLSATGWKCNAETLNGELFLPPGWRALAVRGADYSSGDWLTHWSLLDVFLLLLLTVGCFRLWGWKLGAVAFLAFILSYHESGTPKLVWVILIMMIILSMLITHEKWKRVTVTACYLSALLVLFQLLPYGVRQVQQAIYPQLEKHTVVGTRNYSAVNGRALPAPAAQEEINSDPFAGSSRRWKGGKGYSKKNMLQDSKAKIQTGPAVPEWSWRKINFGWSGPVSQSEKLSFILIPRWLQRVLTILRVLLLGGFLYGLLQQVGKPFRKNRSGWMKKKETALGAVAPLLFLFLLFSPQAEAQYPSQEMLDTLRKRVTEVPKGNVQQHAEIPQVDMKLTGKKMEMQVEVHVVQHTAVPLPGRLTAWSPVSVTSASGESLAVSRSEGYLWVALKKGTHQIKVSGMVPAGDWEWSFQLKPKYVKISAPDWTYTGVNPSGIPEDQVFFVEKNKSQSEEAAYDRKDFSPVFRINRSLELGLEWENVTTVRRLSPLGKAVSLSIPLLPGERILTPGFNAENGRLDVRLGSQQMEISWSSKIDKQETLQLRAEETDKWVEEWQVVTSPVWNISIDSAGDLRPIFQRNSTEMIPIWRPWPGEETTLKISRPEGIEGDTLTIRQAIHKMKLGNRQRTSTLKLSLQNSLGMDFILGLKEESEIISLQLNGKESSVRREGEKVIIPLRPGEQLIQLKWNTPSTINFISIGDEVKLPVDCANTSTIMELPHTKRWVLWTDGPLRGPAVRMWPLLLSILIIGFLLSKIKYSPLKTYEWILLLLGLTQIHHYGSFIIIGWFFWVSLKRHPLLEKLPPVGYNFNQLVILGGAFPVVLIFLYALHTGLLGAPEMRILGESSSAGSLKWFQARGEGELLPLPRVFSVSIWWYRGLMLLWAIWLALSVLKWGKWALEHFMEGGLIKKVTLPASPIKPEKNSPPPPPVKD